MITVKNTKNKYITDEPTRTEIIWGWQNGKTEVNTYHGLAKIEKSEKLDDETIIYVEVDDE